MIIFDYNSDTGTVLNVWNRWNAMREVHILIKYVWIYNTHSYINGDISICDIAPCNPTGTSDFYTDALC